MAMVDPLLAETEDLIRIFFVSIRTANKNAVRESPNNHTVQIRRILRSMLVVGRWTLKWTRQRVTHSE